MCSRAPRRVKNAQPREAPTGRAGALFHRIASSRLPVPTRGRRRRAIVRFDSIRFDDLDSVPLSSRRRPTSVVARARARRRRSVVRVSRGRSRRHESASNLHRICIEFESNRIGETSRSSRDASSHRRPIVVASRLVSSRRRARVVGRASCRVGLTVGRRVTPGPFSTRFLSTRRRPGPPACVWS